MKEFRKNKQGYYICEECEKIYVKKENLSRHIRLIHEGQKYYYDKWIKEENEDLCKICGAKTKFLNFSYPYKNTCSKKCGYIYKQQQIEKANIKKYGVSNIFQTKKSKDKCRQTKLKKYGDKYYTNREKSKQTCMKKYGCENPSSSEEIKNKKAQTFLKHFGVEFLSQDPILFDKMCKKSFKLKQFRDTNIFYQASYELDFLENFYDKYPDIQRGPSIKYIFENKKHIYHPDFYIPSLNLIIEIKNSYLAERFKYLYTSSYQKSVYSSLFL